MGILKESWIQSSFEQFKLAFPDISDKKIYKFLEKKFEEDFKDVPCVIYNNYEMEEYNTTLSNTIDWIDKEKPILTESGTFFKRHSKCFNPTAVILDNKLKGRKIDKNAMFKYKDLANKEKDPEKKYKYSELAKKMKLSQGRKKTIANSEYGISGLRSSFSFNLACASSTTLKGQTLISTAYNAFENFLMNNVKFYDMDECVVYINNIVKEAPSRNLKDEKVLDVSVEINDVIDELKVKFKNESDCDINIIYNILRNLSQEDLNRIYFKNNLYEFLRNSSKNRDRIKNIIQGCKKYMDPVKPPKEIVKYLEKLNRDLLEYIHYNYPIHNRALRLKTEKRKCVRVIDTDSNMCELSHWKEFVDNEILNESVRIKRRTKHNGLYVIDSRQDIHKYEVKHDQNEMFKIINMMAYILGNMLDLTFAKFLDTCNVEPDSAGTIRMKNEFLFEKLLATNAKKHYMAAVRLQEGVYFPKVDPEIKGMEYLKPSASAELTREFIEKMVYDDILSADGVPNMKKILRKIAKFEDSIYENVMDGKFDFIKVAKVKSEDAYVDPMSIGQYKATYVWNYLYPDKQAEFPARVHMLKVNLAKQKDFANLSVTHPDIFNKLTTLFETNDRIKKSGISTIGIPVGEKMPEWVKPYIEMDEIIMSNVKLTHTIINSLGVKTIYKTKSDPFFSGIIEI